MSDRILKRLAWLLPRRLVYWCGMRLWASATTGSGKSECATTITTARTLEFWDAR